MYSTSPYLNKVGAAGSLVFDGSRGDEVDRADEILDCIEGETPDEKGEKGEGSDGVESSKSYGGDNRDGSSVSVTRNGFPTSFATLMTTS